MLLEKLHDLVVVHLDGFGFSPAMPFPFVKLVHMRNLSSPQRSDNGFRLIWGNRSVFGSVKNRQGGNCQ